MTEAAGIDKMSEFRRNALRLAKGTVGGQFIVLLAAPLLTRLYTPADFGQLAVFTSLLVFFGNVSGLKLEQAVLLPQTELGARDVTRLILVLASFFCAISLFLVGALHFYDPSRFGWYLLLVPVAIMAGIVQNIGLTWCTRQQTFGFSGVSAIVNAITNVGLCFLLYLGSPSGLKLVAAYTLGMLATAAYIFWRKWRVTARILREKWRRLWPTLKLYRNFPFHVLPSALMSSLAYQAMPLLITHYFDASITGNYAIANRLLVLPSILIGGAVSEVFKAEFVARMHNRTGHARFFHSILLRLSAIALAAFTAIWIVSPLLFSLVFGEKFALAGHFARYLCLGVGATFLMQPFTYVFIALNRTGEGLVMQMFLAAAPIIAFLIGAGEHSITNALLYSSAATFVCMLVYLGLAFYFVRRASSGSAPAC